MVAAQPAPISTAADWQEALRRWLQWNEAYEELTERMYEAREDPARLETLIDQLDHARREAAALSRELLACGR